MPTDSCPSCGADLKVKRGTAHVQCNICGATFKIKRTEHGIQYHQIDTFTDIPLDLSSAPLIGPYDDAPYTIAENIPRGPGLSERYFLVDTDHAPFLDGQTDKAASLSGAGCMALFLIPFVAVGLFVLGLTIKEWTEWHWLSTAGQITSGRYDERWITTSSDSDSYYTSYFFYVNDHEYHDQIESRQSYNHFEKGAPVDVRYWPDNPHVSSLVNYFSRPSPFLIIFTIFWNGIVYLFVFIIVGGSIRQTKLNRARNKILVEGRIVQAKGHTDSDDDFMLNMEVIFQSPQSGELITTHANGVHNDVTSQVLPPQGTPVLVLYINDNLHEIM